MSKKIFLKEARNQGIAIIAVIVVLAAVTYVLFEKSNILFKLATNKKVSNESSLTSKIVSKGMFNYTLYAMKERWCMDKNWGKDKACSTGSDMKAAITNPLNLERLLWSKSAENDINGRYFKLYNAYPVAPPHLERVTQVIELKNLDTLGANHPLNLIVNENIKRCIDTISVDIQRQNPSLFRPQGDEIYLEITIEGQSSFKLLSKCDKVQKSFNLKSLVVLYPRTLNQFSLIKVENLDIDDLKATSGKGISFNGPVYVQGDLVLPANNAAKVYFRDRVKIGEGVLKTGGDSFQAKSFGGSNDLFLNQIPTVGGFFAGVGLEGEVDAGLSKLFPGSYQYPANTNMAQCTARQKLKDQLSLTKDSRLYLSGTANHYRMALSLDNEFREYKIFGPDSNKFFIKEIINDKLTGANGVPTYTPYGHNQYKSNFTKKLPTDYPIMEMNLSLTSDGGTKFSSNLEYSKILLGRDNELEIKFSDEAFYAQQLLNIDIGKSNYLDLSKLGLSKMGPTSASNEFVKAYDNLRNACEDSFLAGGANGLDGIGHDYCRKVTNKKNAQLINCNNDFDNPPDKNKCNQLVSDIATEGDIYFALESKVSAAIKDLASNPPSLKIKTASILSNQEDWSFSFDNETKFQNMFLQHIESINFNTNVYDFGIDNSPSNTVYGKRTKSTMRPGPNALGSGKENRLNFEILRTKTGDFNKIETKTSDGLLIDNKISASGANWAILKNDVKANDDSAEPPGNYLKASSNIIYPTSGLTVAQARELDEKCDVDTTAALPPSWDISFTDTTQFSWLYNLTSSGISIADPSQVKPIASYTFDLANNDMTVGFYSGVPTRSIVLNCYVESNIDFVFGFYVCENLHIKSRMTPLNLVGTFIVKNLIIDPSASNVGVNFYSIWQQQAIALLQQKKHLRKQFILPANGSTDCDFKTTSGWNPKLSEDAVADLLACSPAKFLYEGANNFNWSTVDPELGISAGGASQATTQSKVVNRYRRFGFNIIWQKEDY